MTFDKLMWTNVTIVILLRACEQIKYKSSACIIVQSVLSMSIADTARHTKVSPKGRHTLMLLLVLNLSKFRNKPYWTLTASKDGVKVINSPHPNFIIIYPVYVTAPKFINMYATQLSAKGTDTLHDSSMTTQLDPNGDVLLIVNKITNRASKSFLVSSKALSLASTVFSNMISSALQTEEQSRVGSLLSIILENDDPTAIELILRIVHFQSAKISCSLNPQTLAVLALHCNKYDCNRTMRPWIIHWCNHVQDTFTTQDFGFMLLAAYMFRSPNFSAITTRAARQLVPDFAVIWEEHETLALLPKDIACLFPFYW